MTKTKSRLEALVLLSGGLDSLLAAKLIQNQGINLIGVAFKSYFFDVSLAAARQAKELNIPLEIINISQAHFEKVLFPEHGYGAGLNPCLDCHLLMIREAYRLMINKKANFLVTGDVLGQRPLSQNYQALGLIDRGVKIEGLVVRPLSAKLLPPTTPEKSSWINREELLAIRGRSRKEQLALAKKFGFKNYTAPAGGCLLTDSFFSKKLTDLLSRFSAPSPSSLKLIGFGRHFWLDDAWIIVGRNYQENKQIEKLVQKGDYLIELANIPGPKTLIRGGINKKALEKAKKLTKRYASKTKGKKVRFVIKGE
jgi:tRNA-uridine 2-sulfurtransferase